MGKVLEVCLGIPGAISMQQSLEFAMAGLEWKAQAFLVVGGLDLCRH